MSEGFDEDIHRALGCFDGPVFERASLVQNLADSGGETGREIAREEARELEAGSPFSERHIFGRGSKAVEDIHLVVEHKTGSTESG